MVMHGVVWCCVLLYSVVCGGMVLCVVVQCCMVLYGGVVCCMVLYGVVWCCLVLYDCVWYMAYGFVLYNTVLPGVRCCFMLYVVVQCYITVISYDVDGGALGCALYCIMLYGVAWCCLRFHGVCLA